MTLARRLSLIATLPLLVLLAQPARAQFEGAAPTRKQQEDLEPLVRSVALRLELHIPSVTFKDVERRVRKVLANQNSSVAKRRYKELALELLIEDLGLTKDDTNRIQYGIYETFGTTFAEVDEALLGGDEKKWKLRKKDAYHIAGVPEHRGCVTHVQNTLWTLRSWNGKELDKDQERGISELADYYEPLLREACGVDRKNRTFEQMVESALSTTDTDRAVLCVLCKLRFLIRPQVFEVLEAETYAQKVDAAVQVDAQIETALSAAEWWPQLREDHAAMIADPDAHRTVLKERKKAEKD